MKLTANFDASEFTVPSVPEPWPVGKDLNRLQLAQLAQWVRNLAGVFGIITSAWRSLTHNAEVGGSSTSQHPKAEALDVVFRLIALRILAERVLTAIAQGTAPKFGQIIFYPLEGHVHMSLPTLGARNGEVRYKSAPGVYPFLTDPATQLPLLSRAQKRAGFQWPPRSSRSRSLAASSSSNDGGGK